MSRIGRVGLDLGAQPPDVDVHQAAVAEVPVSPYPLEQNLTADAAEAFIRKTIDAHSFIKIVPDSIIMKEYLPDFSMRSYDWKRQGR